MRRPSPRAFIRFALFLSLCAAGLAATAVPAGAYSESCTDEGIACIADTGFSGQPFWGYSVDDTGNNCTTYAAFRLAQNGVPDPGGWGNATDWADRAAAQGFTVDDDPAVGSIAQWTTAGKFAPEWGHVAYVERVTPNRIDLSDSNFHGGSKRWSVRPGDPEWPENFIHVNDQPDVVEPPAPVKAKSAEVRVTRVAPRLDRLDLAIECPATGTACVSSIAGGVLVKRRNGRIQRVKLSPKAIELDAGTGQAVSMKMPRRLGKAMRTARRIGLSLRVDTLGVGKPAVIRLRLS